MSTEPRPASRVAVVLGGGVREALLAQPVLRACDGATVFASADAVRTLLGLPSVGRAIVVDDSPRELLRVFRRLRARSVDTVVVPFPARVLHVALAYFAGVPRRLIAAGGNRWAATERVPGIKGLHPVEANWRLGAVASNRPVLTPGEAPALQPPEAVRSQAMARWPSFIGSGRRPLVMIPGGGGWSSRRRLEPRCWPWFAGRTSRRVATGSSPCGRRISNDSPRGRSSRRSRSKPGSTATPEPETPARPPLRVALDAQAFAEDATGVG